MLDTKYLFCLYIMVDVGPVTGEHESNAPCGFFFPHGKQGGRKEKKIQKAQEAEEKKGKGDLT
jgi:hypothetical protein